MYNVMDIFWKHENISSKGDVHSFSGTNHFLSYFPNKLHAFFERREPFSIVMNICFESYRHFQTALFPPPISCHPFPATHFPPTNFPPPVSLLPFPANLSRHTAVVLSRHFLVSIYKTPFRRSWISIAV